MSAPILIVPCEEDLLCRAQQYPVVIRLKDEHDVVPALDLASNLGLDLRGLWVETSTSLGVIDLHERWAETPVALFVPSTGSYRDLRRQIPLLRHIGLRVYVPATTEENILSTRILASLGVCTAVILKGPGVLWEPLTGLMAYALLGLVPRAPIEPFQEVASSFRTDRPADYSSVYFDDPRIYLHVDEGGRIALTADRARRKQFVADSIDMLTGLERTQARMEGAKAWRVPVSKQAGTCAICDGWPVCLGKFAEQAASDPRCRTFFVEMMKTVVQSQTNAGQERPVWPSSL